MKIDLFIPLLVTAFIAIAGWYVAYWTAIRRDQNQKRRDLTVQFLIEAYRRTERAANTEMKAEVASELESAIADIQLFGSPEQVQHAQKFAHDMAATGAGELDSLLAVLRRDLRKELNLNAVTKPLLFYRWTQSKRIPHA